MPPKAKPSAKGSAKKMAMTNSNKSGSGSKAKKKWSKGKSREQLDNAVMWDKATVDKLNSEVPKYKVITNSVVSDRLKISAALAHEGLKYLLRKKAIKLVSTSSQFRIYTRNIEGVAAPVAAKE